MKILHLLVDGPTELSSKVIDVQSKDNEIKIIDMSKKQATYDQIVDAIFSNDKVVSW